MKILVIGDIMLDEYIIGEVTRVSPEAPVPIVRVTQRRETLGGAANVAANIAALDTEVTLLGLIGRDTGGEKFAKLAESKHISFKPIYYAERSTIVKTRIIGNKHQLVRIDDEQSSDVTEDEETALLTEFEKNISGMSIVVISDYGKGTCTEKVCQSIIGLAKKYKIRVLVDPKSANWKIYCGAYLIKPNRKEFDEAVGFSVSDNDFYNQAQNLSKKYNIENVLVTKAEHGMSLISGERTLNILSEVKEVYDVSGAGDTVMATLAVYLSDGRDLQYAVEIANTAAGIAVGKFGTYAVKSDELNDKLYGNIRKKMIKNIPEYVREAKENGAKIVFTNGCFDILHTGHIELLRQAKRLGDILIVGLNSDSSVKRLKGETRPINNEIERSDVLSELSCVDAIVIFDEDTPYNLIKSISPNILVKGGDYTDKTIIGADIVKSSGGKVVIIPLVEGKSTSAMIKKARG